MNLMFQGNPLEVDEAISRVQKAISSTDVSGLLLVREDLQSEMAIAAPLDTPVRNRLSRIPGNGSAHSWYKLIPTDSSYGKFIGTNPSNGFFARGAIPTATQASYQYMSAPYVSLGDMVEVPFFDQMAGKTYTDVKKTQIKFKLQNVALMEELTHSLALVKFGYIGGSPNVKDEGNTEERLDLEITQNFEETY